MNPSDATLVVCLTPAGTGAIATLGVRGPRAWEAIRESFCPANKQPLPERPPSVGTVFLGHCGERNLADEVVLTVKQCDPAPWLEIHSHGGKLVVAWLVQMFEERGLATCPWPEFLSAVEPAWSVAALELLSRASSHRTAAILLDQIHGALPRAVKAIRQACQEHRIDEALRQVVDLLRFAALGKHLVEPWRVVVAGPPNVGKSSLVNALAGFQRSVVASIPGTTRDIVSTRLVLDGWPVELSDTAGFREDTSGLEEAGISMTRNALGSADLCLWVVDATAESPVWPEAITASMAVVVNKIDQPSPWAAECHADARVSALTGAGIPALTTVISRRLVAEQPSPGTAIPILPAHIGILTEVYSALQGNDLNTATQRLQVFDI